MMTAGGSLLVAQHAFNGFFLILLLSKTYEDFNVRSVL